MKRSIRIRGARTHNLQNIDVDLPLDAITVITGVSGSGKSSLAFDTLFAEGQRQFIDSLSAYSRQFLDQIPRPDVDSIEGLAPTLAIQQSVASAGARSTVATMTEIYDYLRLLYARVGVPHCGVCGSAVAQQTPADICTQLSLLPADTKVMLISPMVRGRKGAHRDVFQTIRDAGLLRVRVDGQLHTLDDVPELSPRRNHTIEAVVDRLVIRDGIESRLNDSIMLAIKLGGGLMMSLIQDDAGGWTERLHSTSSTCVQCGSSFAEIETRTFSFNSPYGACATCDGMGVVRDPSSADPSDVGRPCPDCGGARIHAVARKVTINGVAIHQLVAMSLEDALHWLCELPATLADVRRQVAQGIVQETVKRLGFLIRVGLSYLTLDRRADTLSGGETQRVRLASGIGSGLVGVCYVLDEPSIGLHPADQDRLIQSIRDLQRQGNTVVIVEHDEATMLAADHLIDVGPGAGPHGGRIISAGRPAEVIGDPASLTGRYLSGAVRIPLPKQRRRVDPLRQLTIHGVTTHNLKNVTASIPLGCLVGISGVSGSGKSSLVVDTLIPALAIKLSMQSPPPGPHQSLTGFESIDKLIPIDQSAIGRSPRSCPATYAGLFDEVRKVFAATRQAKTLGFKSNRFSFNAGPGRCDQCGGLGMEKIEMNFLSDLFVTCTRCGGKRFNRQTLQVRFKGANVADVLDMTVDEAATFFENVPKLHRMLVSLQAVGLGYVALGQSSTTLSGGEAQRIKLGTELLRVATGNTLYLLDEPTTGLHFADVARLVDVLQRLVDAGNTVLVIEHQFDVLAACDWIIDVGPGGGAQGGTICAAGTPEQIAADRTNQTGRYLKDRLNATGPSA